MAKVKVTLTLGETIVSQNNGKRERERGKVNSEREREREREREYFDLYVSTADFVKGRH